MSIQNWEHFFKPEVRTSGRALFSQGKVFIQQPSDTEIVAYLRISSPFKVSLKTKFISDHTVFADCNCPAGLKDHFCKHIWASLLAIQDKNPDFFEGKTELEKMKSILKETVFKPNLDKKNKAHEDKQAELKKKQSDYKKQQKEKQSLYRKIQYQKQKLKLNTLKKNKKNKSEDREFPSDVEQALAFFSENGFNLRTSMTKEIISSAKKKLARIFHPDLGGRHEEILLLNKSTDILMEFIRK